MLPQLSIPFERYAALPVRESADVLAARTLESHGDFVRPWLSPGLDLLDIGCGPGTITNDLAEAVIPGRVTGLDKIILPQAERLARGREIFNVRYVHGSALALPFADASFDLIFCHATLERLSNPSLAIEEAFRVLRPGGRFAVCCRDWEQTHSRISPGPISRALRIQARILQDAGESPSVGSSLPAWLNGHGFRILETGRRDELLDAQQIETLAARLRGKGCAPEASALRRLVRRGERSVAQVWSHAVAERPA